jgi:hypothetical protein
MHVDFPWSVRNCEDYWSDEVMICNTIGHSTIRGLDRGTQAGLRQVTLFSTMSIYLGAGLIRTSQPYNL